MTTLKNRGNRPVTLCWEKLDRKAKKINFLVIQPEKDLNKKATQETIEDLSREIEGLMSKLDQISMNIVSQRDVESQHFERKLAPQVTYPWRFSG